jgi:hypothetical protein
MLEDPDACPEKVRLVAAYLHATSSHQRSVELLNRFVGTLSKEQYDDIRHCAEQERVKVDQTRVAFEAHILEHGC